jgi:DNA-binding transcriptional regulator YiaG
MMTAATTHTLRSTSAAGAMLGRQVRAPVLVGVILAAGLGTSSGAFAADEGIRMAARSTSAGAPVAIAGRAGSAIAELRRLSGLTWDQLARLFDVSRRSLHFWASGKAMTPSNEEHLQRVLGAVRKIDRGSAGANREALLAARGDGTVPAPTRYRLTSTATPRGTRRRPPGSRASSERPPAGQQARPSTAEQVVSRLAVDLDRVMTVEKSIIARWARTPGCLTDEDTRAFAYALSRKRVRFAFPDDFTAFAWRLRDRLVKKHDKNTEEGRSARALREIRVRAAPSWDAQRVELFFWFVLLDEEERGDGDRLEKWLELLPASGRYVEVNGQLATLEEMTGADYLDSDALDLDHLSTRPSRELGASWRVPTSVVTVLRPASRRGTGRQQEP